MRLWILIPTLALNLLSFSAWGLSPLTSCKILPSESNLPIDKLMIQYEGQDRVRVHFKMDDGDVSDTCKVMEENQSETKIRCLSKHGLIDLVINDHSSVIKLRAIGRSGRIYNASASLSCS